MGRTGLSKLAWVTLLAAGLAVSRAGPADAEVEGPCIVTIAGVDAATRDSSSVEDAIVVRGGDLVPATFVSLPGIVWYRIDLELAGVRVPAKKTEKFAIVAGNLLRSTRFTRWGAGYYKVVGSAGLVNGGTCSGAVLMRVDANPLSTVAGVTALLALVGGAGGVGVAGFAAFREVAPSVGDIRTGGPAP